MQRLSLVWGGRFVFFFLFLSYVVLGIMHMSGWTF
jgi:hypothetical protein